MLEDTAFSAASSSSQNPLLARAPVPVLSAGGAGRAGQEVTNYQFDCEPGALQGALDRFAQFFLAPLCKSDALEREVSAVNNKFAGELPLPPLISPRPPFPPLLRLPLLRLLFLGFKVGPAGVSSRGRSSHRG